MIGYTLAVPGALPPPGGGGGTSSTLLRGPLLTLAKIDKISYFMQSAPATKQSLDSVTELMPSECR